MYYAVQHTTRYRYNAPVMENIMEVRLQPRSDALQQCLNFDLHLDPSARVFPLHEIHNNWVHCFDIATAHHELTITANSVVSVLPPVALPETLADTDWAAVDAMRHVPAYWEWLQPSRYTNPSPPLLNLAAEFELGRQVDPLSTVRQLTQQIYYTFTYDTDATHVDSTIEESLTQRSGVCQDYTHILLALLRHVLHIPARYVSGYLFHREDDRSADDATHAWAEAHLPGIGWVGFDPTNNLAAGERHIRVAYGRDYGDVPPTKGLFRGPAQSELDVSVQVKRTDALLPVKDVDPAPRWRYAEQLAADEEAMQAMQQQQ